MSEEGVTLSDVFKSWGKGCGRDSATGDMQQRDIKAEIAKVVI